MKVRNFLLFAVMILCSASEVYAHERGDAFSVDIVPDRGSVLMNIPYRDYFAGETHVIKKYLEAREGEKYSVVVRNRSNERIGVVISVDGRNIITGRKSSMKASERMYVIGPYESARIGGWRTDDSTVHRFYFTDMKDSYAASTFGDTSAMGVISCAVFREKERNLTLYDRQHRYSPSTESRQENASRKSVGETPGTGFGDGKYSPVVKERFTPERVPFKKILLKYEWRDTLCRKGIVKCPREHPNRLWDEDEYAPFPPGYRE